MVCQFTDMVDAGSGVDNVSGADAAHAVADAADTVVDTVVVAAYAADADVDTVSGADTVLAVAAGADAGVLPWF